MVNNNKSLITGEMLRRYYELNKQKKEIELEMNELKDVFQSYFNQLVGTQQKGEITANGFKLQRQIRKIEKFNEVDTVKRLEELQMTDLIQVIRRPDDTKIKAALELGLLTHSHLDGCVTTSYTPALSVKPVTPR
ncbi:hypothetical protein FB550_12134 [Neobacillus bataviensis]|uniref:Gam-like protein n=1 Tax=Neobacillus bataviensis TaxID=220685 RepID=A0A561CKK3_9BACI|nr:hypothetical protein [Neobacillus bataviensis]TWD91592.1 hypothetical protein FB550_12134 [Neobacillus bataviensis]